MKPNWLLLGIQPCDCLRMEVTVKEAGLEMKTRQVSLNASILDEDERKSDAYEELLVDLIAGDRSLFLRDDEVDHAWRIVEPILNAWSNDGLPLHEYPAGSWGPQASRGIFDKESTRWRHHLDPEPG